MKKHIRLVALILCAAMLLSMVGCAQTPAETTAPPTTAAPTDPPGPDAAALYAQGRAAVDEAADLQLSVSVYRTRKVADEEYVESAQQKISLQGIGTDGLQVTLEDNTTINQITYTAREYFNAGTVWMEFDGLPFTSQLEQESYLSRLAPAVLVDAALYGEITAQETDDGWRILFSQPTAGESWLVPENAELIEASATALVNAAGVLTQTKYTVTYLYGPTEIHEEWKAEVTIPEALSLTNPLTAAEEDYIVLEYIDAPWLLTQAACDVARTKNISYSSVDTMISYAAGAVFSQQESIDIYGRNEGTMYNYDLSVSIQDQTGTAQEYSYVENLQNSVIKITEDEGNPSSQRISVSQIDGLRSYYIDVINDFPWEPQDLTSATLTDLGSVYLLEMTGNDALGEIYESAAADSFWGDPDFLMNLASDYRTETLTAYLSIDKYTQLPVSFGFYYEGVHTLDGMPYVLSDQWDQTFFLGSTTAYEAITEEPLPDVEPETKPTPLFYHVTGEDGQELWLIGTIHVGDDRTGYLPQEIFDALAASDALAVEFDGEAFDEALENDDKLLSQVQDAYFYGDGSRTEDHLDPEIYEDAVKLLKATGNYYMNAEYLKPYLWSQSISNFMLQQGYYLTSDKGVDNRLMKFARDNEIEIRDIESGLFQIQMITGWSDDLQELLLEDALYTDSAAYCADLDELYELWLAGDEAALREELSDEVDMTDWTEEEIAEYEEIKHLLDEYNKSMSYDRNEGMLQKAIEYLESGEVIFYAVGRLAHLLNDVNGLVDALREAGYTVELVTFG